MYVALNFSEPDWKERTVREMAEFAAIHRERLDQCTRRLEFPRDVYQEMGAQGWGGAVAPRAYGGSGGKVEEQALELEVNVDDRLRRIRETCGLSQRALAKRTGVANGLVSMIELGRTSPSVATLKKILDGIPLSLAEFFSTDPITQDDKIVYRAEELSEIGSEAISFRQVGSNLRDRALQILQSSDAHRNLETR